MGTRIPCSILVHGLLLNSISETENCIELEFQWQVIMLQNGTWNSILFQPTNLTNLNQLSTAFAGADFLSPIERFSFTNTAPRVSAC